MDSDAVDALRAQLAELTTKIEKVENDTAAILGAIRPLDSDIMAESPPPNDAFSPEAYSELGPYPQPEWCECRCRFLVRGPNTVGRGVHLGLVLAGDVANLDGNALKQLDDGLKAIAQRLVPRERGALESGVFTQTADDMAALLIKVSLRCDQLPGSATAHGAAFRNHRRGRHLRLEDARQRAFAWASVTDRRLLMFFETFFQMLLFRGIDVEALP
ncbi:hypothetical protein DFP73DRAFT_221923 [Morchella snyderi]|nr:hypothetical protein DFP73DRAFT_221923 [Morchella snyderi]